jgi:acyl transferase domain-containing protein/acyl carrier protein/glycine/D-amino acid oxidase-like deaminating enzyme
VVRGWKSGGVDEGTAMGRVRGYAVNQDGRSNGLTAPNGPSQVRLIRDALSMGALEGADVTMLEAHGTGTSLGDPIEVQALSEAIGSRGARNGLVLSSAKTNFGHTESAAGALGVLKSLLGMMHGAMAKHLNLRKLNDFIGVSLLEQMNGVVPLELTEWKAERKISGVSAFGFSGTNAHVILEQVAVKRESEKEKLSTFVARASGRTAEAVQLLSKVYAAAFAECELASWLSVASVSQRSVFATGLVVVGSTAKEVAKLLREASEEEGKVVLGKEVMVVGESASGKEEEALAAARGAAAEGGTRAELPTYQFSRSRFWPKISRSNIQVSRKSDGSVEGLVAFGEKDGLTLFNRLVFGDRYWTASCSLAFLVGVADQVGDLFGGSGIKFVEVELEPLSRLSGKTVVGFRRRAEEALELDMNGNGVAKVLLASADSSDAKFDATASPAWDVLSSDRVYQDFARLGFVFGKQYRVLGDVLVSSEGAHARVVHLDAFESDERLPMFFPEAMEAVVTLAALFVGLGLQEQVGWVPRRIKSIDLLQAFDPRDGLVVRVLPGRSSTVCDVVVGKSDGTAVLRMSELEFTRLVDLSGVQQPSKCLFELKWSVQTIERDGEVARDALSMRSVLAWNATALPATGNLVIRIPEVRDPTEAFAVLESTLLLLKEMSEVQSKARVWLLTRTVGFDGSSEDAALASIVASGVWGMGRCARLEMLNVCLVEADSGLSEVLVSEKMDELMRRRADDVLEWRIDREGRFLSGELTRTGRRVVEPLHGCEPEEFQKRPRAGWNQVVVRVSRSSASLAGCLCFGICVEIGDEVTSARFGDRVSFVVDRKVNGLYCVVSADVLTVESRSELATAEDSRFACGTFVIAGGTGGLGLQTALQLVELGATDVVLLSRRGVPATESSAAWSRLQHCSDRVSVSVECCDVSDLAALKTVFSKMIESGKQIKGIVFSVFFDNKGSMISATTPELLKQFFDAKVTSAWNLHKVSKLCLSLEHFVVFSSMNGLLGSVGGVGHASSNVALDRLVELRLREGLPAVALQLGPVSEVGSAARMGLAVSNQLFEPVSVDLFRSAVENALVWKKADPVLVLQLRESRRKAFRPFGLLQTCSEIERDWFDVLVGMEVGSPQIGPKYENELVVVIGAGMQGLAAACLMKQQGRQFVVFEKETREGGVWVKVANEFSRAQTECATYHIDQEIGRGDALPAYATQSEILSHFADCVKENGLAPHLRFGSKVVRVSKVAPSRVHIAFEEAGVTKNVMASHVMVFPGRLAVPRVLNFTGEDLFGHVIGYGFANCIKANEYKGKDVVVVGHGAFGLESARTALEQGAASVTIVCRKRTAVLPRVGSWMINASSDPLQISTELAQVLEPMYALARRDPAPVPVSGLVPITDFYFLAQWMGKLRVVESEVDTLAAGQVCLKNGEVLKAQVLVKCPGLDPDPSIDRMLGLVSLNGFWVNKHREIFLYREGVDAKGVAMVDSTTAVVLLERALEAQLFFMENPQLFTERLIRTLPEAPTASRFGAMFIGLTYAALQSRFPVLQIAFKRVLEQKVNQTKLFHPLEVFLKICERDWMSMSQLLNPSVSAPPYPFRDVRQLEALLKQGPKEAPSLVIGAASLDLMALARRIGQDSCVVCSDREEALRQLESQGSWRLVVFFAERLGDEAQAKADAKTMFRLCGMAKTRVVVVTAGAFEGARRHKVIWDVAAALREENGGLRLALVDVFDQVTQGELFRLVGVAVANCLRGRPCRDAVWSRNGWQFAEIKAVSPQKVTKDVRAPLHGSSVVLAGLSAKLLVLVVQSLALRKVRHFGVVADREAEVLALKDLFSSGSFLVGPKWGVGVLKKNLGSVSVLGGVALAEFGGRSESAWQLPLVRRWCTVVKPSLGLQASESAVHLDEKVEFMASFASVARRCGIVTVPRGFASGWTEERLADVVVGLAMVGLAVKEITLKVKAVAGTAPSRRSNAKAAATPSRIAGKKTGAEVDRIIRQVLDMDTATPIDVSASFQDMGFDSVLTVEFVRVLQEDLRISLPATLLFDFPTVALLKEHVDKVMEKTHGQGEVLEDVSPSGMAVAGSAVGGAVVAICGGACRVASAWTTSDLWRLLEGGSDMVSVVPASRWKWEQFERSEGPTISKWGCFFEGLDLFDAAFFNISMREAKVLDPLHRMLLECSWECLESCGKNPAAMTDVDFRTSVYVGIQSSEYQGLISSGHMVTGTALSTAAGRISYVLGTTGEAMSIDTACSSSLVATASGCRSLQAGLTNGSLCLGVNAMVDPNVSVVMSQAGMMSSDGRCKTFDASANGFVRGEGCVAILLQRMEAVDHVLGRVLGHGVNQDGRSNGLTAPNGPAQVRLIRETMATAQILKHRDVQMIEAHGTGTSLGDPIEAQAVAEALGSGRGRHESFVMGSAKTNFGHTETAAGVLGVLKVLLCMEHECIARHLHLSKLNDFIGLGLMEGMQCIVPLQNVEWNEERKIAGVSSFGFSGTNAHLIIEHVRPVKQVVPIEKSVELSSLRVSGKTLTAVAALASAYAASLKERGDWTELCACSWLARPKFPTGLVATGRSAREIARILRTTKVIDVGVTVEAGERMSEAATEEMVSRLERGWARDSRVLPTTRFERRQFWVDLEESKQQSMYAVVWKERDAAAKTKRRGSVRVLGASASQRAVVVKQLQRRGHNTAEVLDNASSIVWLAFSTQQTERDAFELLRLLQGLAKQRLKKLLIVSRGGVRVREDDGRCVAGQAALWGLGRVARVEQPEVNCVNVDVDTVEAVVAELENEDGRAYECAYREGKRLVPVMEQLAGGKRGGAGERGERGQGPRGLRFLVTGGFGALASGCMTWLVQGEAKGAVLVGRRGAQEEHAGLLSRGGQLEDGVACLRADSSVAGHVKGLVGVAGQFEGLLHLAGEGSAALLSKTRGRMLASSFKPKVGTLRNLERAGVMQGLKNSVLFSSQATMVPVHGQGAYAAANFAMEAFASSTSVIVCWGAFADVGMYLQMSKKQMEAELRYWVPLESESIPRLLRRAGEAGKEEVGVFNVKWETFPLRGPSIYEELQSKEAPTSGAQLQAQKQGGRAEKVDVEGVVKEVLGMGADDVLDLDAPMQDLGFDSMMSVELSQRLSEMTEVRVSATVAYDYPSVRQLKLHMEEELRMLLSGQTELALGVAPIDASSASIEVAGSSCRFSSARDVSQLWQMFAFGRDQIVLVPASRWSWKANYGEGKSVSKWGGFMDGVDEFDAAFFGISPREARTMDPQHRILLECAWECVEAAGFDHNVLREEKASVSVYVGIQNSEYEVLLGRSSQNITATGISLSVAAGRISYILGWTGEALSIDTACSSSLVALVQGHKSLEHGGSTMSLCCGVNAMLDGNVFVILSAAGMLSPDGRCKTFDASANGYVRGEGCATFLLKKLFSFDDDAFVLRGCALNQDGRSNGLTAPNGPAQVKLIREALRRASIGPNDVQFVEAHGTGTSLGDPIEAQAVREALGKRSARESLLIASAKTNFGHTESASGLLGALKVILQMRKSEVVNHLHLRSLNEFIGVSLMEEMRCVIPLEVVKTSARFSSVSSFGFSGTNAHVILEKRKGEGVSGAICGQFKQQLIVLSGRTLFSLSKLKVGLQDQLEARLSWSEARVLAESMWFKRTKWPLRSVFVATSAGKVALRELVGPESKTKLASASISVCASEVWRLPSGARREFSPFLKEGMGLSEAWSVSGVATRAGSILVGVAVVNGIKAWGCVVDCIWGAEARFAIEHSFASLEEFFLRFPQKQLWFDEVVESNMSGGLTIESGRGYQGPRRTPWIHASGSRRGVRNECSLAEVAGLLIMSGKHDALKWLQTRDDDDDDDDEEEK